MRRWPFRKVRQRNWRHSHYRVLTEGQILVSWRSWKTFTNQVTGIRFSDWNMMHRLRQCYWFLLWIHEKPSKGIVYRSDQIHCLELLLFLWYQVWKEWLLGVAGGNHHFWTLCYGTWTKANFESSSSRLQMNRLWFLADYISFWDVHGVVKGSVFKIM